ncbi:maestro heat-like repeat-containing protein family member 2B [Alligator mississippiensis]|uniref:Maestro heat-like repeat-containing protein family member 2B n=1 Tax=Alligator mississippiensis TaxID=8496 RepID=A0A151NXJ2_ALLMI|nr:maestro heat-like repeat-containing protein family member 2B [Alligator mississippiensis]
MVKVIGKYFPSNQSLDFLGNILDSMLSASPTCTTAADTGSLQSLGSMEILFWMRERAQVLDILETIFIWMLTIQERSVRGFLLEGISVLAGFHLEAVISSLLRKPLPMDSDTSELWRALSGERFLHPLHTTNPGSQELEATCASLEMLTTIHSSPVLRKLLPEILCALLEQVRRTVGQYMPMPTGSIRRRQLQKGQLRAVGNPCRLSMETLACAISKGLGEGVAAALCKEGTWTLLESPQMHHERVCQLARWKIQAGALM